jgi:hypothetical protein
MNLPLTTLAVLSLVLASCGSNYHIDYPPAGTPGIVLKSEQVADHKYGRVTFPAGRYVPEARSDQGIYYASPSKVMTGGVVRNGKEHGGLFLTHETFQQSLWVGQPGYQLQQASSTLMGKAGVETPIRFGLKTPISYTRERVR